MPPSSTPSPPKKRCVADTESAQGGRNDPVWESTARPRLSHRFPVPYSGLKQQTIRRCQTNMMANLSASDNGSDRSTACNAVLRGNACTQPVNSTHQARVTALIQVVIVSFTSRAATGYTVVCSGMRLKVFTVRPEASVSVSVCSAR